MPATCCRSVHPRKELSAIVLPLSGTIVLPQQPSNSLGKHHACNEQCRQAMLLTTKRTVILHSATHSDIVIELLIVLVLGHGLLSLHPSRCVGGHAHQYEDARPSKAPEGLRSNKATVHLVSTTTCGAACKPGGLCFGSQMRHCMLQWWRW